MYNKNKSTRAQYFIISGKNNLERLYDKLRLNK